jgi:allantoicase
MTNVSETSSPVPLPAFTSLPDLASRALAGSVVAASDELFAQRENLIKPEPSVFSPSEFGHKGKVYDGWETRRRRQPGHDWAIVRLGVPGVIRGVVIDTAYFRGNFPPECSVEACRVDGYPAPDELHEADWTPIVPRSATAGDIRNTFAVSSPARFTHVRLSLHPDGGVARLRVHGEPVPDPRTIAALPFDLAALVNGGRVLDASNRFFSRPDNLLMPGPAQVMGDGWETARRRDDGNDWVLVRLAGRGELRVVELDTTHFLGNAPGQAALRGLDTESDPLDDPATAAWVDLLPRTRLQPDTPHRFVLPPSVPVTHVRLDVFPDGGLARLRCFGRLTTQATEELRQRWNL